jgi:hypothetical protein
MGTVIRQATTAQQMQLRIILNNNSVTPALAAGASATGFDQTQ